MADIFAVVADGTRRDILHALLERIPAGGEVGELSVSEIVDALGISQPTVSKHLRVLREAGLVEVREEGQHRFYSLSPDPLEELEDWLVPFLSVGFLAEQAGGADADAVGDAAPLLGEGARSLAGSAGALLARLGVGARRLAGKLSDLL